MDQKSIHQDALERLQQKHLPAFHPSDEAVNFNPVDCDVITRSNQKHSPLLRLPAELRSMIYDYAIDNYEISVEQGSWIYGSSHLRYWVTDIGKPCLLPLDGPLVRIKPTGLYTACYQLWHETHELYWTANKFYGSSKHISAFLERLGPRAHCLRVVRVVCEKDVMTETIHLAGEDLIKLDQDLISALRALNELHSLQQVAVQVWTRRYQGPPEEFAEWLGSTLGSQEVRKDVELVVELQNHTLKSRKLTLDIYTHRRQAVQDGRD